MSILNVENLSFGFEDKVLLKNVSFRLLKGDHAGLVGANGAGKTTLFNILTGSLIPDDGNIHWPTTVKIGHLDQHYQLEQGLSIRESLRLAFEDLYKMEQRMIAIGEILSKDNSNVHKLLRELGQIQDLLDAKDFYTIDSKIDNVAGGLGLQALGMDTLVEHLSGGQKTKVKLAKLLLNSPDILLLDEPTNYLDKEHVDWLAGYLSNYPNSFMVISHDNSFLNRITNVIYHIEFACLKRYPGNHDSFLKLKDEETKRYIQEYHRQQKTISSLESFINKNIVRASTTKRAQSRRKQLDKIERLEKPKILARPSISFSIPRESARLVFKCTHLNIGYNYPLVSNLSLKLIRGQKIAVTGCNGIGKSTLLKTIMGVIPPLKGKVELGEYLEPAYYEQETTPSDNTALDEVWSLFPDKNQREIREALARCGLKQEHVLQKMSKLSGGEQSKVRLCKLTMTPSNWLILDEPTNHLDANAKAALKEALIHFKGTILFVCHEKEFYQDWVSDIWNMEDHAGFFDHYGVHESFRI